MADDEQVELSKTEARGGETPGVTRYVLSISLGILVVLFAIAIALRLANVW